MQHVTSRLLVYLRRFLGLTPVQAMHTQKKDIRHLPWPLQQRKSHSGEIDFYLVAAPLNEHRNRNGVFNREVLQNSRSGCRTAYYIIMRR